MRRYAKASRSDHRMAVAARLVLGTMAIVGGLLVIRSIPDLVRYVKIERM